ncbi:MAG: NAD(P)-dependent oxidoreductase [Betaproteobacteria bacterium HGW-Betaproteobacteria-22]|nr:MAG: NAD(P)-dependent oxidoreductase [Betaproteobacteria bacterium HGW-Betaproteobacteria-22]
MADALLSSVLIVGFGDLGGAIANGLNQLHIPIYGVSRSLKNTPNVDLIHADVTQPETLSKLATIKPQIIVYCVSADGQTDAAYQAAYVDGLRNVLATQRDNVHLQHVFFVSSTRVYGRGNAETDTEILDVDSVPNPDDFGGVRLLEAESVLNELSVSSTVLRLSGIYGPGRLRMINLAKTGVWPAQNNWSNRIHRDDAAAFVVFLIEMLLQGTLPANCYIVTDSAPVPQLEVIAWIASYLNLNEPELITVSGGKRLSNAAMLATGFKLQYPDYQTGYKRILENLSSS